LLIQKATPSPGSNFNWQGGSIFNWRQHGVTFATANTCLNNLVAAGLIRETTGKKRGRIFRFDAYLNLFDDPIPAPVQIYEIPGQDDKDQYQHGALS
jgi:hypothetical protein